MNEKNWRQWRHRVEVGGVIYASAVALVERLKGAYIADDETRDAFDMMAKDEEFTAHGISGFEATLVIIPIADVRGR